MTTNTPALPRIASREEWLRVRRDLLEKEKALTHQRDALAAERRRLPMVRLDKDYRLHGPDGELGLADMFGDCRQLIVYHFMFGPDWERGCPSCSAGMDQHSDAITQHLRERDTAFACVSRASIEKLMAFRAERGWTFDWYSSFGSDFNYDFRVTLDESVTPMEYNYRGIEEHRRLGSGYYFDGDPPHELPGYSCFLRSGDEVFHTYSSYGRGTETVGGSYYLLDMTAYGRQEDWEDSPAGWPQRSTYG
jgi:predicted dithiol-disulfide oxidoreductase (DUF899 family)